MYLFHQCATSLLSKDGHITDSIVRHPDMERPFSSLNILSEDIEEELVMSTNRNKKTQAHDIFYLRSEKSIYNKLIVQHILED